MKKFLKILLILLIAIGISGIITVIGCVLSLEKPISNEEFIREGHSFLILDKSLICKNRLGIIVVHNPDCPCYAKRAEELADLVAKQIQDKNKKPSSNQSSGQHSYYIMPTVTEKKTGKNK